MEKDCGTGKADGERRTEQERHLGQDEHVEQVEHADEVQTGRTEIRQDRAGGRCGRIGQETGRTG